MTRYKSKYKTEIRGMYISYNLTIESNFKIVTDCWNGHR